MFTYKLFAGWYKKLVSRWEEKKKRALIEKNFEESQKVLDSLKDL